MRDESFMLIGLSLAGPRHEPFWTRAVPVGAFHAITLVEGKTTDRATLMAICRACCFGMPDFFPIAPSRISRQELAAYAADQEEALRALIARVGGLQESILTVEWTERLPPPPGARGEREWLPLRALRMSGAPARRDDLAALARRLATPAASLTRAEAINAFDGGCDLSLLHTPKDEAALARRIGGALRKASALQGVTAGLSGPFPPYSFIELPPYTPEQRRDIPR